MGSREGKVVGSRFSMRQRIKFSSVGQNFEFSSLYYDEILMTLGVAGLLWAEILKDCTRSAQTKEVEVKGLFCPVLCRISGRTWRCLKFPSLPACSSDKRNI